MIGCIAETGPEGEDIHLGHDPELENAKWFTFDEVKEALRTTTSSLSDPPPPDYKEVCIHCSLWRLRHVSIIIYKHKLKAERHI